VAERPETAAAAEPARHVPETSLGTLAVIVMFMHRMLLFVMT
jgi:hypothetical protein